MPLTREDEIPEDMLAPRQREFLNRLRGHDRRAKVYRDAGGQPVFHGPVIGDGPMPPEAPASVDPGSDDEP
jgi:hypothetical protein